VRYQGLSRTGGFFYHSGETTAAHARRKKRALSHFAQDLVQSVCALHKHEAFALSQHVLRLFSSRNLDVARRMYNYGLARARRLLLCAFCIECNKWRIFHCAIDVCPDFCDVTVKTCCVLHNFARQRDGLQFHDTLYERPLESFEAIGNRRDAIGTVMGRRVQGTGMSLCWGAWQRASLTGTCVQKKGVETGTSLHRGPIGTYVGWSVHQELQEIVEGGQWKRSVPVYGHYVRGTWRGALS